MQNDCLRETIRNECEACGAVPYRHMIEIVSAVLGLIQGVLVLLNRWSNWIVYILQMVFLVVFSWINKLYGDVVNNSIYVVLGVIGLITWRKDGSAGEITVCKAKERICYILLTLAASAVLGTVLSKTDDPLPYLDAFTTVSSFVATFYMMRRGDPAVCGRRQGAWLRLKRKRCFSAPPPGNNTPGSPGNFAPPAPWHWRRTGSCRRHAHSHGR